MCASRTASPAPSRTSACSASSPSGRTCGSPRTATASSAPPPCCGAGCGGATDDRERLGAALEFSGLAGKRDDLAANLSFGEQRRLELARALAAEPKLLLLDEPAAGMNAEEIDELDARIRRIRDTGVTVVLIEHHMELIMAVADRIGVLNFGQKIAEGRPGEVQSNAKVREAYLGTAAA